MELNFFSYLSEKIFFLYYWVKTFLDRVFCVGNFFLLFNNFRISMHFLQASKILAEKSFDNLMEVLCRLRTSFLLLLLGFTLDFYNFIIMCLEKVILDWHNEFYLPLALRTRGWDSSQVPWHMELDPTCPTDGLLHG